MASTLYETLGVSSSASQDEIRRAYKRRALQTHPDRLGPNLTAEQKLAAEEAFREVTAAYEVLFDPEQRALYDRHGEWPPPEPLVDAASHASGSRTAPHTHHHPGFPGHPFFGGPANAFPDPFAGFFAGAPFGGGPFAPRNHPMSPHHPFVFSDPFDLFRQLFGDPHSAFDNDPFFARDPLFMGAWPAPRLSNGSLFADPFFGHHPMVPGPSRSGAGGGGGGGYNISESFTQRTINGRTETIRTRQDGEGNVHVKRTGPDGRTSYTINGVEAIEGGGDSRRPHPPALDGPPPLAPANLMAHPVMPQHQRHRNRAQTVPASVLPDYSARPYPSYARTPLPYPNPHAGPMPAAANNQPPPLGPQGRGPIHEDNRRKWWKWN